MEYAALTVPCYLHKLEFKVAASLTSQGIETPAMYSVLSKYVFEWFYNH